MQKPREPDSAVGFAGFLHDWRMRQAVDCGLRAARKKRLRGGTAVASEAAAGVAGMASGWRSRGARLGVASLRRRDAVCRWTLAFIRAGASDIKKIAGETKGQTGLVPKTAGSTQLDASW